MTREELVKLAREVVAGIHRPDYCENPASFDPHEWVLEAMQRAYERGQRYTVPFVDERGRTIGDARVVGTQVIARVTDEQAALALRSSIGPNGVSVGYRVEVVEVPAESARDGR
jgi:hypothetical protein